MFGKRLKRLRENKNLTQEQLGSIFGLVKSSISMYENGIRIPDSDLICKFAEYFGVSTDYLLGVDSFSNKELLEIEQLRQILIGQGIMSPDHEMTKEEFNNAMEFYKANAKFFLDK